MSTDNRSGDEPPQGRGARHPRSLPGIDPGHSPEPAPERPGRAAGTVAPDGFPGDPRWVAWMARALVLAQRSAETEDVPVGALVVDPGGAVIGEGWNAREAGDPTAHAEVVAIRRAATTLGRWRLAGCTLVVTLEPCAMCAGAALAARVERIVVGAWDDKAGACGSVWDLVRDPRAMHRTEVVGGVLGGECASVLRDFFVRRRLG